MLSNISEKIQQEIVSENKDFKEVIIDVADGFKRCGFFNEPDWKNVLLHGFERKRLGLANGEIQYNTTVHTSVLSDDSFIKGLTAQSTPVATGRTGKQATQTSRNKRALILPGNTRQSDAQRTFKRAKSSADEIEAAKILVDLKKTDWTQILPSVNEEQNVFPFVNVFENSRRVVRLTIPPLAPQTSILRDQNQATASKPITKRRNAIYIPATQHSTDPVPNAQRKQAPVTVTQQVSKGSKSTNAGALPLNPADNGVLTNVTNRRLTRKQSQLLAAFSRSNSALGTTSTSIAERRATAYFQRTSVLFTMVDTAKYKTILHTYNIFVADTNEKYDYVITERICRSPKFLSAVVSGKPILSVEWLHELDKQKIWLDPLSYLLKDDNGEREFGFNLSATLLKATNKRLFENYSILVTPHTTISPNLLKDVIFSGGGKYLKTSLVPRRGDEIICISDGADKKMWPTILRKYPTLKKIISLDGFSKMIFKYTHDVSSADILHQI
ncbi:mediator of DNA damage checkpoint protein 1 [Bradysia coprophila]|uniref:mediator of DNA damage checkpoint protein 1 n=1 Tax=Bradysia coprophila TaxID=38358 RepID=UPI00187DACC8|nr:mediator of DNA damage checkpoint protein 1 [Bradysia coprophila]